MKAVFIIQGEGRGHLSQAIAMKQMLEGSEFELVQIFYGINRNREIPKYLKKNFSDIPITYFQSPAFIFDKHGKKLKILKSFAINLFKSFTYFKSIYNIHCSIKASEPDIIINFYDLIGGLMNFVYKPKAKYICMSHHFYFNHPSFQFPKKRKIERLLLLLHNKIVSLSADKKIALSFRKENDILGKKLFVAPPLIRKEILSTITEDEEFILSYLLKDAYADQIIVSSRNVTNDIHVFCDNKEKKDSKNITIHSIDNKEFLSYLSSCKGYVCTSGFDSICEAMFLQKPIMVVPVKNHFEQYCNAIDFKKENAGLISENFEIKKMVEYINVHNKDYKKYIKWVNSAKEMFLYHLKN